VAQKKASRWAWVVAAAVHFEVWQMYTMQTGSRAGAAGYAGDRRVLPGGMEMQVWQQVVHAMNI